MEKQKPNQNRPVLGKGLASLLSAAAPTPIPTPPTAPTAAPTAATATSATTAAPTANPAVTPDSNNKDRHHGIAVCAIEDITMNDYQPRKTFHDETIEELARSIKANGLIQPLIVRKGTTTGYQLIAGERRLRAAKIAGLKQVPIVIRRTTNKEALELALIENIQREELNCLETAMAYYQLIQDFNFKQEELAERLGKDRSGIANHLRLLRLPQSVQTSLRDSLISYGHGKALAGVEDTTLIEKLAWDCVDKKWSVRELENQIQKLKNLQAGREAQMAEKEDESKLDPITLRLRNIGKDLSAKFSTKVQLRGDATRGKIVIEYFSQDDLDRVLEHVLK